MNENEEIESDGEEGSMVRLKCSGLLGVEVAIIHGVEWFICVEQIAGVVYFRVFFRLVCTGWFSVYHMNRT